MRTLFLIPARAGSKGLPGKNTKLLGEKTLIEYSIDFALNNLGKLDRLCVSTNDEQIVEILRNRRIEIPFIRPIELSTDTSSTYDVIIHALSFYETKGCHFDTVLLLQPTSPFRISEDLIKIFSLYDDSLDMVVSVKKSKENPYFNLFEESASGYLYKSKSSNFITRQECPSVYAFNGSLYLINVKSLYLENINDFKKVIKMVMPDERSIDIDNIADWALAEYILNHI